MTLDIEGKDNIDTFFVINFNKVFSKETQDFCGNLLLKVRKQIE